jgi:hypothetical protein
MPTIMTRKLAELYGRAGIEAIGPDGLTNDYQAGRDYLQLMADYEEEKREVQKWLVRRDLEAMPDTSADAIAEFHGVSKYLARSLCRGLARKGAANDQGNDYETRNYAHW